MVLERQAARAEAERVQMGRTLPKERAEQQPLGKALQEDEAMLVALLREPLEAEAERELLVKTVQVLPMERVEMAEMDLIIYFVQAQTKLVQAGAEEVATPHLQALVVRAEEARAETQPLRLLREQPTLVLVEVAQDFKTQQVEQAALDL
jgi:hypothetical protein